MKKKKKNPSPARRASRQKASGPEQIELIADPALSAAPTAAEREPEVKPDMAAPPADEANPSPAVAEPMASEAEADLKPTRRPAAVPEPIVAHVPEVKTEPAAVPDVKAEPMAAEPPAESVPTPAPVMKLEPPPKPVPFTKAQPVAQPSASVPVSPAKLGEAKAEAATASQDRAEDATPKPPEIDGYEFLRLLERTSSGEMWIARRRSARLLAVRVVPRDHFASEADYDQAFEAVRAYEPLSRAHIGFAGVLQSGRTAKCLYYTSALPDDLRTRRALPTACPQARIEAYSPRTLQSTLAARGALPTEEVLRLGISLTATLQTLHAEGRAYGVVRPEHVVFVNGEPKLGGPDFETIAGRPAARTGDGCMAPEGPGTPRADLYSLGHVLHEASKGRDDSRAGAEAATDAAWSAQWRRVLAKACADSPARRYQTAQEFQNELVGLLSARLAQRKFWTPSKVLALAALFLAAGVATVIQLLPDKIDVPTTGNAEQPASASVAETAPAGNPPTADSSDGAAIASQPANQAAPSEPRVAARPGVPVAEPPQAAPVPAPAISETLPPIAAGPMPVPPAAKGPDDSKPGDPATTSAATTPATPANAPAASQELAALTSPTKTSEPKEPQPEPMQPGKPWTNSLGMKFVPVGEVNFCVWETRVKDYEAFCKATGRPRQRALYEETENHPVVKVSWSDARAFCAWLTQKESAAEILPEGHSYRLPTDLEWSSAVGLSQEVGKTPEARDGGIKKTFPWGSSWPPSRGAGNFADAAAKREKGVIIAGYSDGFARTAPVGSFRSNRAGLFDLAGNVWEWCEDTYGSGGSYRVARGGSWVDAKASDLASSYRNPVAPDTRSLIHGFRCVLAKPAP